MDYDWEIRLLYEDWQIKLSIKTNEKVYIGKDKEDKLSLKINNVLIGLNYANEIVRNLDLIGYKQNGSIALEAKPHGLTIYKSEEAKNDVSIVTYDFGNKRKLLVENVEKSNTLPLKEITEVYVGSEKKVKVLEIQATKI